MSINICAFSGNLTRDPELRTSASGSTVLTFGLAVSERRKNAQTGEWEDQPGFYDMVMFGNRAEAMSRYLRKGSKVAVKCRAHWHSWTDQQGNKRSKVDFFVDEIEFLSPRDNNQQGGYTVPAQQQRPAAPAPVAPSAYDEELPF